MTCPVCGGRTIVYDSRPTDDIINRRRKCIDCEYRFSTVEVETDIYIRKEEAVKRANKKAIDASLQTIQEQLYTAFRLYEGRE